MNRAAVFEEALFGKPEGRLRLLVCGGRGYEDSYTIYLMLDALHRDPGIFEIIQGGARGADAWAARYAKERHILCSTFHANWEKNGKAAGPIRNQRMLDMGKPDMVLAFPGGRGTAGMVELARKAGVYVYWVEGTK